jgi:hypothetical protein
MDSFRFQQRIIPVAGRLVGVLLGLMKKLPQTEEYDLETLMAGDVASVLPAALPALGQVFAEMPDGELERITKTLLADATVDHAGIKGPLFGGPSGGLFDTVMRGRNVETWQLLWHAMGVWYPDFFALVKRSNAPAAKAQSLSVASST